MGDNEFYQKLGTYDSKGVMVRRIVTEVVRYLETSWYLMELMLCSEDWG